MSIKFCFVALTYMSIFIANGVRAEGLIFDDPEYSIKVKSLQFKRPTHNIELRDLQGNFVIKTDDVQLRINDNVLECLAQLNSSGNLTVETFTSDKTKQWFLWDIDKFQPNKTNNWIPNKASKCGNSKSYFLGGPCVLGPGRVNRIYNGLPKHTQIKLTGRLHFFDKWEGEGVSIKADGILLHNEHHNWCPTVMDTSCRKFGIDVCGQEYPDKLSVYFDVEMNHTNSQVSIELSSSLKDDACVASWGLDDVSLYLR